MQLAQQESRFNALRYAGIEGIRYHSQGKSRLPLWELFDVLGANVWYTVVAPMR